MPSDPRAARTWLVQTIALILILSIAVVLLNMAVDIYGLFRNAKDRRLPVFGDERIAKYLLSEKYVPTNFDAVLVGSSVSANWNTGLINSLRVYNESLNGGNIVEEKALVDQALPSQRIKVAIVVIHPYLTSSHEFETVRLTPRENFAAFGSQSLLEAYKDEVRQILHHSAPDCDEFGTHNFNDAPKKLNATLQKMMTPGAEFEIDGIALSAHRALIAGLHAAQVRIVYVIPPISQALLVSKDQAFAHYAKVMLQGESDRELVIDFNCDDFLDFRKTKENFIDGVHVNSQAARKIVAVMNGRLTAFIGK